MTNEERETHFNIVADNRAECEVFSDDPVWRGRMEKWFTPYKTRGEAAWFRAPTSLVIRASALTRGNDTLKRLNDAVPCEDYGQQSSDEQIEDLVTT